MKGQRAPKEDVAETTSDAMPAPRATELEAIAEASSAIRPATPVVSSEATVPAGAVGPGGLGLGWLAGEGDAFELRTAVGTFPAQLDAAMHPAVAQTARSRNEAVLYTRGADGAYVVVGALRTSPTPGVDDVDEITLKAKRITIEATEEAQVRSGAALIAVRAIGEVETYADRIMSRAEEVQKIVARMLRLN
jgi:hypothetical protein